MPNAITEAYVTLVTSDNYVVGALVLGHSLRQTGTTRDIVCMVTSDVDIRQRDRLASLFSDVVTVPKLDSHDTVNLRLLGRPELGITFTKINAWTLTMYHKVVFLDADMLVLDNMDDLFSRPELSACPDVGWPDCFNSGLLVLQPSMTTFESLVKYAGNSGSFDGGDQGLLNGFFSNWSNNGPSHRIPFTYNLTFSASYSYAPAYRHYRSQVKAVHFIGANKPWLFNRFTSDGKVIPHSAGGPVSDEALELIQLWWTKHDEFLKPLPGQSISLSYAQHDLFGAGGSFGSTSSSGPKAGPSDSSESTTFEEFSNYRVKWNREVEESVNRRALQQHRMKSNNAAQTGNSSNTNDEQPPINLKKSNPKESSKTTSSVKEKLKK